LILLVTDSLLTAVFLNPSTLALCCFSCDLMFALTFPPLELTDLPPHAFITADKQ
jgi:hypothetical protein